MSQNKWSVSLRFNPQSPPPCALSQATLSVVNVSALPDKGERLKSQVKELEDALQSLSLTTDTLSGETRFTTITYLLQIYLQLI